MLGVRRGGGGEQEAQKGVRSGNVSMIILICPFDNMVSPFIASHRKNYPLLIYCCCCLPDISLLVSF